MNKIKTHIFLLCMLLTASMVAQDSIDPVIEWTKKQPMVRKKDLLGTYTYLGGDEKQFIFIYGTQGASSRMPDGNFFLVKMDMQTGKPEYTKVEPKTDKNKRTPFHLEKRGEKILVFSSFQNKKDQKHYLFLETMDIHSFKLNDDVRKIGEISYGEGIKGSALENVNFTSSPNGDLHMLTYSIMKGGKITNFGLTVLHNDMSQMWQTERPFPSIEGKNIWLSNHTLDNDGNAYIAQNRYDKKNDKWELFITYFPSNNNGEPQVHQVTLDNDNHSVSDKIITNNIGEVICSGFYTKADHMSPLGMYSYVYSPGLKELKTKDIKEFSEDFITKGMTEKDKEKIIKKKDKGKEFDEGYTYRYKTLFDRTDGGYTICFEKYKLQLMQRRQQVPNGGHYTTLHYHNFNDIVIVTYNANGTIRWIQKIPKRQRLFELQALHGSFYADIDNDDNIKFIYNENILKDNMDDKVQPILVNVDSKGDISYTELFKNDKEVRKTFAPMLSHRFSGNKYLLGRIHLGFLIMTPISWGITELK